MHILKTKDDLDQEDLQDEMVTTLEAIKEAAADANEDAV